MVVKTERNASCFIINHHTLLGSHTPSFSAQRSQLKSRASPGGAARSGPEPPWQARRTRPGPQPSEAAGGGASGSGRFPAGGPPLPASESGATPDAHGLLSTALYPPRATAALTAALLRGSISRRRRTPTIYPTQQNYGSAPPSVRAQRGRARNFPSAPAECVPQGLRETRGSSGRWAGPPQQQGTRKPETRRPWRELRRNSRGSPKMGQ